MKKMKICRRWLSLILSVALLVSAVPSLFTSAEADGQATAVIFDGTYMGWFTGTDNNSYTVRTGTPGVLENKRILRITAQEYKDGWNELYLNSKTLSENGISDTSALKTVSFFVKTDNNMNALKLKLSDVKNDRKPYEAALITGRYYLLDTEKGCATAEMLNDGYVNIPGGFTGYVVYDLESCDQSQVTALMNLGFESMRLWFPSASENELDTSWYFGELAVSEKDAGTFMADYAAGSAVSYRIHSGDKTGTVWDSPVKQTAETGVEGILDGQKVVRLTFKDFGWLQHYTNGLSLTSAGIAADDVQAISVFIKADEKYDQNIRFGGYNEGGETPWVDYNYINSPVILYDINSGVVSNLTSNVSGCVTVPAGFTGYMIYDLRNEKANAEAVENLLTKNDGLSPLRFGAVYDKKAEDETFEEQTFYYGDMRVWTAGNTSQMLGIFAAESGTGAVSYRIHAGDKAGFYDDPNQQTAEVGVEGVLDGQKVVKLTFKTSGWKQHYTDGLSLTAAGIAAGDVQAISVFIKADEKYDQNIRFGNMSEGGETPWVDYNYINSPVILYDINSGAVSTLTSNGSGCVTVPAGFTGYMIYDLRNEKADAAAVENLLTKNDGFSPVRFGADISNLTEEQTFYYGDMRVWTTGDGMSAAAVLGADLAADKSGSITVLDMEGTGTYNYAIEPIAFNTETVDGVSPDGTALKLTRTENENAYVLGWHDFTEVDNLSGMKALSFWVKAPDGLPDTNFHFCGEGYGFTGTVTTVNTATGEVGVKYEQNKLSLPAGFEGYVIFDLETAVFNKTYGDDAGIYTWQTLVGDRKNSALGFYYHPENITAGQVLYLDTFKYHTDAAAAAEALSSATLAGDVNNDGVTDVLDLIRAKKYLAGTEETINYFNAKFTYEIGYSTADLASLRKLLLGQETAQPEGVYVPAALNKTGAAIFHMTVDEWNYSGSDVSEEFFVNNYGTYDVVDLKGIKAKGGVSWLQLSTPAFADGSTEIPESWKTRIATIVEAYKRNGVYNTMAGFIFEECLSSMTVGQHIAVTKYLRETYPDKRVFDVLQYSDISSDKITPESFEYVTDIAYDWYHSIDAEAQKTLLNTMLEKAGNRSDLRVWFFPLACELIPSEPLGAEYDIAHINMCYDMLKSLPEEQQGGLVFYNWLSFEEDGQQISVGIEDLISNPGYAAVIDRMVEISKEILNK